MTILTLIGGGSDDRADDGCQAEERGLGVLRVVVRAAAVWFMPSVKAAWCCQHVCGFRYADEMLRLVASKDACVDRRGRALHGKPSATGCAWSDRRRHRRRRRHRSGAAGHQRTTSPSSTATFPGPGDEIAQRIVASGSGADPDACRRRPA